MPAQQSRADQRLSLAILELVKMRDAWWPHVIEAWAATSAADLRKRGLSEGEMSALDEGYFLLLAAEEHVEAVRVLTYSGTAHIETVMPSVRAAAESCTWAWWLCTSRISGTEREARARKYLAYESYRLDQIMSSLTGQPGTIPRPTISLGTITDTMRAALDACMPSEAFQATEWKVAYQILSNFAHSGSLLRRASEAFASISPAVYPSPYDFTASTMRLCVLATVSLFAGATHCLLNLLGAPTARRTETGENIPLS